MIRTLAVLIVMFIALSALVGLLHHPEFAPRPTKPPPAVNLAPGRPDSVAPASVSRVRRTDGSSHVRIRMPSKLDPHVRLTEARSPPSRS